MLKFIVRRIFWTIPVLLVVIFLTFIMMRQIEGQPLPADGAGGTRGGAAEPRAQVQPRQALVAAVPVLRQGRLHARLRPVARAPRAIRQRHHEGALPEVDRARRLCVPLRDRRRRATRDDRSVTPEHLGRLHGDVLLEHLSRAPQLPGRDADDLFHRAQSRLAADERLDRLGVQDPARDRARVRADGALRAARPWDDARDAAAGLRAHRACQRASATGASSACTCSGTR